MRIKRKNKLKPSIYCSRSKSEGPPCPPSRYDTTNKQGQLIKTIQCLLMESKILLFYLNDRNFYSMMIHTVFRNLILKSKRQFQFRLTSHGTKIFQKEHSAIAITGAVQAQPPIPHSQECFLTNSNVYKRHTREQRIPQITTAPRTSTVWQFFRAGNQDINYTRLDP